MTATVCGLRSFLRRPLEGPYPPKAARRRKNQLGFDPKAPRVPING
jgi:hypothetical protein